LARKQKTPSLPARSPYEFFSVAADIMALRHATKGWEVLLIQRKYPPFQHRWALPGGFLERDEDAETAAVREFREETGLVAGKMHEFGSFSDPGRDPRGRTVTISFYTLLSPHRSVALAGDDAGDARWFPVKRLPPLAFDHREMIKKGWIRFCADRRKKNSLAKRKTARARIGIRRNEQRNRGVS
jgi:8-oxo-dGTP diphosphatase